MAAASEPEAKKPRTPRQQLDDEALAIFQQGFNTALKLLGRAYDLGKQEAALELREKVVGVLGLKEALATDGEEEDEDDKERPAKRAPRGSVRPAVIEALKQAGTEGLRSLDVAERTGINENSVRGALNILAEEGLTLKRGDRWFLK